VRALEAAAEIGPFFAWDEVESGPAGDWRPLADLAEPAVLAERVSVARRTMAAGAGLAADAVPERVAASVLSLGMFARLLSPPLAAVALVEALPAPRGDRVWWRAVDGGPLPVAVAGVEAVGTGAADDDAVAAAFAETVVDGLVGPLLAAFRHRFRLSPKVLHGNVASALGGAVTMLAGARPDRVGRAARVLERLLARDPLVGAAVVRRAPWRLRRNNCCLYYRLPGGGYCGDCVLRPVSR
jgi:ferric iron reductase protein FhuF